MRAMVLEQTGPLNSERLREEELPTPEPKAGEVLISVRACGVCRSNLHMIVGDWAAKGNPAFTPIIPGHEVVGVVESVGDGVTRIGVGDRVGIQPLWDTCGDCEHCLSGVEQRCQEKQITGETVHGGYADHIVAKAEHVYRLPDEIDDVSAAPLFCPGITAYGAVAKAQLGPSSKVAIFGIGGVGHMALQFARLTGAHTIAVSRSAARRNLAGELGADQVLDPVTQDIAELLSGQGGVDVAIVFAPSSEVAQQAIEATKPGGMIILGVNADPGIFNFDQEKRIVGSLLGSRKMMREVLQLAAEGKVKVTTTPHPMNDAIGALEKLAAGEVRGRLVLVPS